MEFKFYCPHCGQHISATDDLVGSEASCPNCQRTFVVPSITQGPQPASPSPISTPPSRSSIPHQPASHIAPNLCPFCRKEIDRSSTVCPYCTKNVGMVNLQRSEPEAYAAGMVCAVLALPLAYVIHKKVIDDCFKTAFGTSGCCAILAVWAIGIFVLYGIGGFWIGFTVCKSLRK
jgi:endogenous inhibitor of DNA gyrase (YacG/DUF329 family)